ncbi:alcohol dehydrogenase catalytic domain-containing protein [Candidatus Desantisbacteria bacterium]|nr:alcohol dehydrogenase catalytic domain-containing protein [Candidatus Desantisbacteria bacterium]
MKAIIFWDKLEVIDDYPKPVSQPDEALIRVSIAGICNTDLEIIKGYMGFKGILGHEFVGVVDGCDNMKFWGKRVVGEINCGCGKCQYCQAGQSRHCPSRNVIGIVQQDGAFANYLILPIKNLHIVPDSLSDEEAVFTEPLAAALQILEQVEIKSDNSVIIIGDGKLGLLTAQVISQTGCLLTVVGHHLSKLGKVRTMHPTLKSSTPGNGIHTMLAHQVDDNLKADIVIECSGSPSGFALAQRVAKPMARIVLKSTFAEDITFNPANMVINEITLIGSRCGPFDKALRLLEQGSIDVQGLISAVYPVQDGLAAFEAAKTSGALKVLLKM